MSSLRSLRRTVIALLAVLATALLAAPAGASDASAAERMLAAGAGRAFTAPIGGATWSGAGPTCYADPADDVVELDGGADRAEPRADLVEHCVEVDEAAGTVTLSAEVATPTDPMTDQNWTGSTLAWFIDDDQNEAAEFFASIARTTDGLAGNVQDRRNDPAVDLCDADAAYTAPTLTLTIELDCLERPFEFGVAPGLIYDQAVTSASGVAVIDVAPNDADFEEPVAGGGVEVTRIGLRSEDNVQSAIRLSLATVADGGADEVLLGRDDLFADSLSSGGAQGALDAPLLVTPSDELDDRVVDELERLGAEQVTLLGGEVALAPTVEAALIAAGYTTRRLAGPSRLETAIAVAAAVFPDATTAVLARAFGETSETEAFADSIPGGAYAAHREIPVLLSETEMLSDSTEAYLADSAITTVVLLGGEDALSEQVVADLEALGITVERLAGGNRFATAVEIAQDLGYATGADAGRIVLAEGQAFDAWAPGFAAALYAARNDGPLLVTNAEDVTPETAEFITGAFVPVTCTPYVDNAACDEAGRLVDEG